MARNFNGTSDYLGGTVSSNLSSSFTFAAWIKTGSSLQAEGIMQSRAAAQNNYWAYLDFTAGGQLNFELYDGTNNPGVRVASAITINTRYHVAGVRDVTNNWLQLYKNGTQIGTNINDTTTSTPVYSDFFIGKRKNVSDLEFFKGDIAECAVWNVVLTAAEIAALNSGVSPNRIRRTNLVFYAPIWGSGSPEPDLSGNLQNMTVTGTTVVAHAPVGRYTPTRRFLRQFFPPPSYNSASYTTTSYNAESISAVVRRLRSLMGVGQ